MTFARIPALAAIIAGATLALSSGPALAQAEPAAASLYGMVGPGLYISDPARSLKFYTEGLGMQLRMRFGPPDRPDMVVGFGKDPMQPGIMLLTDKEGPTQRPIEHAHGFARIALRMPDLPAVSARLRAAGFEPGKIREVHGGIARMMMVTDPDGYRIELIDSLPAPKRP